MQICQKSSMLNISFHSNLTANYIYDSPTCITNIFFVSAVEDNSMLKERFAIPGMIALSLPKFGNLTSSN